MRESHLNSYPDDTGSSQNRERHLTNQWEQQCSSPGSSRTSKTRCLGKNILGRTIDSRPQGDEDNQDDAPMAQDTDDDPMGEEVVDLWEAEDRRRLKKIMW